MFKMSLKKSIEDELQPPLPPPNYDEMIVKVMPFKWGIISTGKISHDFVCAIETFYLHEHVATAVAASSEIKAKEFADKHKIPIVCQSYSAMANAPVDVVYIGAINTLHFEIAKEMLENGKPVLCEKPLCVKLSDTEELIRIARKNKVFLMEGIWSRCFPVYRRLRTALEEKAIGDIIQVHASFGEDLEGVQRLSQKSLGGGTVLDLGVYLLQLVILVFGDKPKDVHVAGSLNSEGVDEWTSILMDYGDGKIAVINSHSQLEMKQPAVLFGTHGTIEVKYPFWCPTDILIKKTLMKTTIPKSKQHFNFVNSTGLTFEMNEVRRCLLEGLLESELVTHEDSLSIARLQKTILDKLGVQYD